MTSLIPFLFFLLLTPFSAPGGLGSSISIETRVSAAQAEVEEVSFAAPLPQRFASRTELSAGAQSFSPFTLLITDCRANSGGGGLTEKKLVEKSSRPFSLALTARHVRLQI